MTQFSKTIFGALAISVACGAVQLAFGHDLSGLGQAASVAPETGINRAAKADRDALKAAPSPTRTIALRFNGLPDTSVLLRMPVAKEAARQTVRDEARDRPAPSIIKPADRKTAVACEPVVSVLTEVAKLLQPGRCVT
jgi:hypothetical protein